MNSISRKLLVFLLGGLMAAGIVAGGATYLKAREELDELFDYQLDQMAHTFARQGSISPLPPSVIDEEEEEENDFAIQVWENGNLLSANPPGRVVRLQREGFGTVYSGGQYWRTFVLRTGDKHIQVSQPIEARRDISVNFALRIVIPLLAAIPFFGLFIWLSVKSGLGPLTRLADEISRRSSVCLDPLSIHGLPAEIRPLVDCLNLLLEKLAHAIESQKRFVADAAHELRTPLAALGLQLKILERSGAGAERNEALVRLKEGVGRATRLVSQLLVLARLEPEAPPVMTTIALTGLAGKIVAERSGLALEKDVDLGMIESDDVTITGEEEALRAMIGNLVDNAVRYTPPKGTVDVMVRRDEGWAIIEVADTGPGIAPEDRERVFERFYRCGSSATGSGLGLAIVKSAVERHAGSIILGEGCNGTGLTVTVKLPFQRDSIS